MIPGLQRLPLRRFEDDRGWFMEMRRDSLLPRPTVQTPGTISSPSESASTRSRARRAR